MPEKQKIKIDLPETKGETPGSKRPPGKIRAFIHAPAFNIVAMVLLLASVFIAVRLMRTSPAQSQIKFVERTGADAPETGNSGDRKSLAHDIFKGEVYGTSIRLRETGGLGMAISLAVFARISQEKGSVPPDLENIWRFILERGLMPPGLKFENGELLSPTSSFIVRFQGKPLRFEIVSRPREGNESPAILLRFPLTSLDRRTITYFQSGAANRFDIPAPFAPLEKIVAVGWTIEQWRGAILPKTGNPLEILEEEKRLLKEMQAEDR